jgi:hypothetical protein
MARHCTVCAVPEIDKLNVELAAGASPHALEARYGVNESAIGRHRRNHLSPAVVRLSRARRREASAEVAWPGAIEQSRTLLDDLRQLFDVAVERKSLVGGAQVARELRGCIELLARLTGELDERNQIVTVNVLASPEVAQLVDRLLGALTPYPEAMIAAAAALKVVDAEEVAS